MIGAEHERDGDPVVVDDAVVQQGAGDGQDHANFAGADAALGRGRGTHPFQRQDEERAGDEIGDLDDGLIAGQVEFMILSGRSS